MNRSENNRNPIIFDEVARIIKPEGGVSIYRFQARRLEDLEGIVADLRDSGFQLVKYPAPDRSGLDASILPITVYLAGPAPQTEVFGSNN